MTILLRYPSQVIKLASLGKRESTGKHKSKYSGNDEEHLFSLINESKQWFGGHIQLPEQMKMGLLEN